MIKHSWRPICGVRGWEQSRNRGLGFLPFGLTELACRRQGGVAAMTSQATCAGVVDEYEDEEHADAEWPQGETTPLEKLLTATILAVIAVLVLLQLASA